MEPSETVETESAQEPPYSTWLLESLFTGKHRRLHPIASQVLGLLGLIVFALLTTVGLATVLQAIHLGDSSFVFKFFVMLTIVPLAGALAYVAVLFTLHWVAACQLFFTIRLAIIYAIIFFCLKILAIGGFPIEGGHVLLLAPFSAFGFVQHRRGWVALAWGKAQRPRRPVGIVDLLDATSAIALTFAMTRTADFELAGLACVVPAAIVMAFTGAHVWGRVQMLSTHRSAVETGQVIWHTGNAFAALLLFLISATAIRESPAGLFSLLLVPVLMLVVNHWSRFAMSWLRWCGWRLENQNFQRKESTLPAKLDIPQELLGEGHAK
ncbi:MAG: hypothetical protein WBD20_20825 [Pirellulaceae bacterium]